jgi:hypothetical protein
MPTADMFADEAGDVQRFEEDEGESSDDEGAGNLEGHWKPDVDMSAPGEQEEQESFDDPELLPQDEGGDEEKQSTDPDLLARDEGTEEMLSNNSDLLAQDEGREDKHEQQDLGVDIEQPLVIITQPLLIDSFLYGQLAMPGQSCTWPGYPADLDIGKYSNISSNLDISLYINIDKSCSYGSTSQCNTITAVWTPTSRFGCTNFHQV